MQRHDDGERETPGSRLMAFGALIAMLAIASWVLRSGEDVEAGPYQVALVGAAVLFIAGAILRSRD